MSGTGAPFICDREEAHLLAENCHLALLLDLPPPYYRTLTLRTNTNPCGPSGPSWPVFPPTTPGTSKPGPLRSLAGPRLAISLSARPQARGGGGSGRGVGEPGLPPPPPYPGHHLFKLLGLAQPVGQEGLGARRDEVDGERDEAQLQDAHVVRAQPRGVVHAHPRGVA